MYVTNFDAIQEDLSVNHKYIIKNIDISIYKNNYYPIDSNEIRYDMTFRVNIEDYKKWLDYREELIEKCDFREDSQKLVNYITLEFIQWAKDNNIELNE